MIGMPPEQSIMKARFAGWLRAISLFMLLSVVALRPLVAETYDSAGNSIGRAIEVLADPSPARTLGFDLAILIPPCLWLLSSALDRGVRYRWTGLEIGFVLLSIAGVVSCYYAGNKRLAINGTLDWLCFPILTIMLVQLLRTQWQRRLVLAAILASATVNAAQCYEQYFMGFAETIEQYEASKEEFWAKQGVELDSTTVDAFERRLRARETTGFFAHSNVAGAYLMLCAFAAMGLIVSQLRRVREVSVNLLEGLAFMGAVFLTLALIVAIFLTGSTGAIVAGIAGLALLSFAWWKSGWIASHRRAVFWISWTTVVAGFAAVIGHGLYHDSLPGWSLTFRWQYWKATAAMIADHFWTGVGRENFGRHYTFYKDIASPEEVSNPHNFLLQAFAEWGVLGFVAVVVMLVGVTHLVARSTPGPVEHRPAGTSQPKNYFWWATGLTIVAVLGRAFLLGTNDPNYVYYAATTTGLIWLPAFLVFCPTGENQNPIRPVALSFALGAGLFAFLLQDMISFALFIPASATTFFALLGIWITERKAEFESSPPRNSLRRLPLLAAAVAMTSAYFGWVFMPVARANYHLKEAARLRQAGGDKDRLDQSFQAAASADPLDPTPEVQQAEWLASLGDEVSLRAAFLALDEGLDLDYRSLSLHRRKTQLHLAIAHRSSGPQDYLSAVDAARRALALYPQDPAGLVTLADTEFMAGRELQSKELLLEAIRHYREALALDEKRLEWETIQRFRPRVVEEIHAKIRRAESMLQNQR